MADPTDYYATLGVARDASTDDVRRAYRKLARKHHPDVNPGNKDAEDEFKRISAAYEVLSSAEKRKLYDEFGAEGLSGGFDPERARAYQRWSEDRETSGGHEQEIPYDFDFGDLFGARGSRGGRTARRQGMPMAGEDIHATVTLDFVTALRGTLLEVRAPVVSTCATCSGSGAEPGSKPETCPECGGSGKRQVVRGPMNLVTTCARCGGDGELQKPCPTCSGRGTTTSERSVEVRVPPGADDGSELRVRGQGGPGMAGGPPGDLIIHTKVLPHRFFTRDGLDLMLELPITLREAHGGATVAVPTLSGTLQVKIPPRAQSDSTLRLRGKGVTRGSSVGDLYLELQVRVPDAADEALESALKDSDKLYTKPVREEIQL